MDIVEGFNEVARRYDAQRRKFVPGFDDFYGLPVALLNGANERPAVLDMGAGTGIFSAFLLKRFPLANITLADLAEEMLDVARERFAGNGNVRYLTVDYTTFAFPERYDLVISALSIHHIPAAEKEKLYRKCYGLLNPGGVFVNADIMWAQSPFVNRLFEQYQWDFARASGLSEEELRKGEERAKFDDPSTLEEQVGWLRDAGFSEAECVYRNGQRCSVMAWR